MTKTTVGQLMINRSLPVELRDFNRVLDKKGIQDLLQQVAEKYPDQYKQVVFDLSRIGYQVAYATGGNSFGLDHLRSSVASRASQIKLRKKVEEIYDDKSLDEDGREKKVVRVLMEEAEPLQKQIYDESMAEGNPLAMQVLSGARGNKMNLKSLRGGDLLYVDHHDRPIPIPILRSYSQGLTPAEYFAGTFGARKGVADTKFSTQDAGFFCLAADTLIRMGDFSVKPIEQIRVGDVVLGADQTGRTFPVRVTAVFDNGVRPLYRFLFRYGRSRHCFVEITATSEHRALLRHLRRNRRRPDPVLHKTVTTSVAPLGDCERRNVSFYSLVPAQGFVAQSYGVEESWAWFIGLLLGDGGLTTNHLGYSCGDPALLTKVMAALAKEGFTLTVKTGTKYEYAITDKGSGIANRLRTKLSTLGLLGLKAPQKFIPQAVTGWNNRSVAALIRGIFDTDGGVATSAADSMPFLRLGMTAQAVVEGVRQLLADRFGIYGQVCRANVMGRAITAVPGRIYYAKHDCFSLTVADRVSVNRFASLIGFDSSTKQEKLQSLLVESTTADREDQFLFHYLNREFVGNGPTYDIEVDHPDHLFVLANGAVVSNSKQLNQVAHRLVVSALDADNDGEPDTPRGLPASVDDPDNEGALLAAPAGKYPRNTVLTPKILADIRSKGVERLLVRSPIAGGPVDGGVYARDLGIREKSGLSPVGDFAGIAAAQALSEPLAQAQLSSKHSGGVAGAAKGVSGFKLVNQLVQVPKTFKGGAAHAQVDGRVNSIRPAPQGGNYVTIDGEEHYVGSGYDLLVKPGDHVEAGDILSEGIPNPAEIVKHKGVGEGRRYFTEAFRKAYKDSGITSHRRNIELLSRGLIDHVRLTDEMDDYSPDDVVPYSRLEHFYKPRAGFAVVDPRRAAGMYLEKPVLHYSIGTRIRPSVLKQLEEYGVKNVYAHKEPPPFEPEMVRGMESLSHDPDWMTRFLGSYLQKNLLKGVHRADKSDVMGTSYVPALSAAADFGRAGKTVGWRPAHGVRTVSVPVRVDVPLPPTHPDRSKSVLEGIT